MGYAAADIADWWDKQKKASERELEHWVDENPQWWTVVAATAVQTSMDLGQGMVDALRFGEGAAEGGVKGFGKDFLRLITLAGPLGKAGGMLSRMANARYIRFAVSAKGMTGPCTFTAANNALTVTSRSAKNLFLTAKEAAKALNKPLSGLAKVGGKYKLGAWIDDLIPFLRSQGARIKTLQNVSSVDEAVNAARTSNGVVVFAIKCTTTTGNVIKHSVIAFNDGVGVKFADYGGKFVPTLERLVENLKYGAVDAKGISLMTKASNAGAVLFEGSEVTGLLDDAVSVFKGGVIVLEGMTAIETYEDGVDLAMPVVIAAAPVPAEKMPIPPEVVKESFNAFKARVSGKPVLRMPEIRIVGSVAPRADWLTGVQYRLNAVGFGAGPVDGVLGPRTRKALRQFQETYRFTHSLMVDETPGPKTQSALVSICGY
ncbi:MAG: peptidoglycan-binding domain-containing protein [Acidobacteriota bacterium]